MHEIEKIETTTILTAIRITKFLFNIEKGYIFVTYDVLDDKNKVQDTKEIKYDRDKIDELIQEINNNINTQPFPDMIGAIEKELYQDALASLEF